MKLKKLANKLICCVKMENPPLHVKNPSLMISPPLIYKSLEEFWSTLASLLQALAKQHLEYQL